MGDVPLGPGVPNPFGFDLEQLMRMLQSEGPVNLDMARQVATAVATADAETTGIPGTLGIASVCVDRAGWADATIEGLVPVFNALAGALRRSDTAADPDDAITQGLAEAGLPPEMGGDIGAFLMQSLLPLLL